MYINRDKCLILNQCFTESKKEWTDGQHSLTAELQQRLSQEANRREITAE